MAKDDSGCFSIFAVLIFFLVVLFWLLNNPDALFGITFLMGGSFVSGKFLGVLCRIAIDKYYESRLTAIQAVLYLSAGILLAGIGLLVTLESPMATFFVIGAGILAAVVFLNASIPDD